MDNIILHLGNCIALSSFCELKVFINNLMVEKSTVHHYDNETIIRGNDNSKSDTFDDVNQPNN